MNYAAYDEDGVIVQWGSGEPPPGCAYIEHTNPGSLADYCVLAGELVEKPLMTLTVSSPTAADGVAETVVSGLPVGTIASFLLGGEWYYVTVDDGTLEISAYDPQTVSVRLWHGLYQHPNVEVVFV